MTLEQVIMAGSADLKPGAHELFERYPPVPSVRLYTMLTVVLRMSILG